MTTRTTKSAAADEIAAIEDLMNDLEKRLRRLSSSAKGEAAGASTDVRDFVSESLGNIMDRVRDSAANMGKSVADETSRVGADAMKRSMKWSIDLCSCWASPPASVSSPVWPIAANA